MHSLNLSLRPNSNQCRPVRCDKCRRQTIVMTRILCLGCYNADQRKTTDYCASCIFSGQDVPQCHAALFEDRRHPLLQLRQFTCNKWGSLFVSSARDTAYRWNDIDYRLGKLLLSFLSAIVELTKHSLDRFFFLPHVRLQVRAVLLALPRLPWSVHEINSNP